MLNMFRNFTKSRTGIIVVFLVLGVIAIAFAAGDVTGLRSASSGSKGQVIARVGAREITDAQLTDEIDRELKNRRAQGQTITMEQFLASPLFDQAIERLIDYAAIEEFGTVTGMRADSTLLQSDIANDPSFQGFDGKFSQAKFDAVLAENRISAASYRARISTNHYLTWLVASPAPIAQMPIDLLAPYASLPLERRTGSVALIRWNDTEAGADPDEKTLATYYQRNRARYMIPPRRILRYALVRPDQFKAQSAATEAEIAAAFAKAGPRYAATEKRTLQQLVMLDQAAATAAAAEIKGGKSIADAAKARGLEPRAFAGVEKVALAKETSASVAEAAFGAPQGATVGPVRAPLGWVVMHVDKVESIAAKTLAQAHDELADEITQRKVAKAIGDMRKALDESTANGATFDQAVAQGKLTPVRTAALAPDGTDPAVAGSKADPALAPVIQAGFAADPTGLETAVVPIGQDGSFAVIVVEKALAAAAKPLASIHDVVLRDYLLEIRLQKARKVAADVVNLVNKGTPLQQALAASGIGTLLPPKPFAMTRQDLVRDLKPQQGPPPQYALAFQTGAKRAKLVEAPDRVGYYIVYVDMIEPHDARGTDMMAAAQKYYGPQLQNEAIEQFVDGIKRHLKVTRNSAVINAVRADLGRQGAR